MKMTKEIMQLIRMALKEDVGKGDITSRLCIPSRARCRGKMIAWEEGVVAGLWLLPVLFRALDRRIKVKIFAKEGSSIQKNRLLATFVGPARSVLTGERTALNFVMHLSGIATLTRRYVDRVRPYRVKILATRKTTPGWRYLEKYALRMGGGEDHRMGLYDQVLIKENHLHLRQATSDKRQENLKEWIQKIRKRAPRGMKIEAEAQSLREFRELLSSQADIILLDNLSIRQIRKAVWLRNRKGKRPLLGVSGGVTLANVRQIAKTGVDRISVGRMTHSAPAINISIDIENF